MNLSQVAVIVEIAKAGSISKAAQNMFISQPGVSKILRRFEEEVGVQIFERVSTGIRLTPIGRRFVENAIDIIEQVDKLEELFSKKSSTISMELGLASMSYRFMQQMIAELYNKYQQNPIAIQYTECSFEDQLEYIRKGELELGVVTFWKSDLKKSIKKAAAKGVEYHRLGSATCYIGISKRSRRYPADIEGLDLVRLTAMPIVTVSLSADYSTTGWDYVRQILGVSKSEMNSREIRTSNTGTMQEIVSRIDGFSLIVLNNGIREQYGFSDDIRLIPLPDDRMQFEMGWLQRANTVRSPLANEFINMIRECATED